MARASSSISYLGLTREASAAGEPDAGWRNWYRYFPWEDWRDGPPRVRRAIEPRLGAWARGAGDARSAASASSGSSVAFACGARWNEELVLQRYEMLCEAGLVPEAGTAAKATRSVAGRADGARPSPHPRDRHCAAARQDQIPPGGVRADAAEASRCCTCSARSRRWPGVRLHKQNFRRLIEQQGLVEETGEVSTETGGRPAKLFRFRREVLVERAISGARLPVVRSA